jgi:hypothetical protein
VQEEIKLSTSNDKGWLEKTKDIIYENWQTILVALIVLIVGVSAYNNNKTSNESNSNEVIVEEENNNKNEEEQLTEQKDEQQAEEQDQAVAEEEVAIKEETPSNDVKVEEAEEETVQTSNEGYEIAANKGEGVTHLARKALEQYMKENADDNITNLHKIYIEDYLQNKTGNEGIEIGHKEFFSKSLIQEAITSSKKLSDKSLDNLKKYSIQ